MGIELLIVILIQLAILVVLAVKLGEENMANIKLFVTTYKITGAIEESADVIRMKKA